MEIFPIPIAENWLVDGCANVVLAQIQAPTPESYQGDHSRTHAVTCLRHLLGAEQGRKLGQIIMGDAPAILIFPELAFGSEDWESIDVQVRSYPGRLIVMAGFGITSGQKLNAWKIAAGATERLGAWTDVAAPAHDRFYNCGWCWIHSAASTKCILFHKTSAEQTAEIQIDGLAQGSHNLCLELDDLLLFPTICSDLLHHSDGGYTLHRKIGQHIAAHQNDARKVLIAGLLLQSTAHSAWPTAIVGATRHIHTDRVNVCLVNGATNLFAYQEDTDRWRDYSGVYATSGLGGRAYSGDSFNAVRVFKTDEILGSVARDGAACVLGGSVLWQTSAVARHLWSVQKDYSANCGALSDSLCKDRHRYELCRFVIRATQSVDAPEISKKPFSIAALDAVAARVKAYAEPTADFICRTVLYGGPDADGNWQTISADKLAQHIGELELGTRTLGAFAFSNLAQWKEPAQHHGQLRTADGVNILIWSSPGRPIFIREKIDEWRTATQPTDPLIVYSKANGTLISRPRPSDRRIDISAPPRASTLRSADQPKALNVIVEAQLDELDGCFEPSDLTDCAAQLKRLLAAKTAQLGN